MKLKAFLLSSLVAAPLAFANAEITTQDTYARATPPTAVTSAVFGNIHNSGDRARNIVSVSVDAAGKSELHDVIMDGEMMKMRHVDTFVIPANGKLPLKPGGHHIMMFDLKHPLKEGQTLNVTLTFANGEKYQFQAPVKKVMAGMSMNHNMDHGKDMDHSKMDMQH